MRRTILGVVVLAVALAPTAVFVLGVTSLGTVGAWADDVLYTDTHPDPNDVPIDPTSCCQQDPDIERTTRRVWIDEHGHRLVTISFKAYEPLDDYWTVRVRLDARGGPRYDATMWIRDDPPGSCKVRRRGDTEWRDGILRLPVFGSQAFCRVPRGWLAPTKRIRWKLFSPGGGEGTGPAVDEYAPDSGWYV